MSRHHVAAACLALGALRPAPVLAAHPLITEDTGTQGRGGWQLELTAEHGYDREQAVHTRRVPTTRCCPGASPTPWT